MVHVVTHSSVMVILLSCLQQKGATLKVAGDSDDFLPVQTTTHTYK